MKTYFLMLSMCLFALGTFAQSDRWQQKADYEMEVELDVKTHKFGGTQRLVYYNNSPDTLHNVYYHLYLNAFQPGSMMDVRSRTIEDPDGRVKDRISKLQPNEIGYQKVLSLKQNGKSLKYKTVGTILEVELNKPILPNTKTVFAMEFDAQVPIQIRRTGRDNKEGVAYSMAQWYPKLAEYDYEGWHPDPYVGREFYGIWGDFDVKLTLDEKYVVAATGYIQNAKEVGYGYEGIKKGQPKDGKLTWHFVAPNVHDFTFAADPDFQHKIVPMKEGPELHFFWKKDQGIDEVWNKLPAYLEQAILYTNKRVGKYPYKVYNVVQGGDGGMEYGMLTLITGKRSLNSLVGVTVHEMLHSWFQFVLATNESLYAWMDEGFNSYIGNEIEAHVNGKADAHGGSYNSYFYVVKRGIEEPLSTHADHFEKNAAYSIASYSKGAVFLHQLSYIMGQETFDKAFKRYYEEWKFKHPNVNDFMRVMEKESGLQLQWYKQYFVNSIKTIDYGVKNTFIEGDTTYVTIERVGKMPMPTEVKITLSNGDETTYYMPLRVMRGAKKSEIEGKWVQLEDWPWTHPTYTIAIPTKDAKLKKVEIDPSGKVADIDRTNNILEVSYLVEKGAGL
ncbi:MULTISPECIES: M1 family metallopeptidase [unclassified Flammeovirga]|uniref:M1 family metallopeptidase n=1 Tax=unclassified Flammeovirga TaxID=2637820 RepID=UPI0005C6F3D9|nr:MULTISPECIES: M1 family metallopeptidase [unclassified Flammeovirga]MBD0401923.1 M1 family metallopeptidase [Flammeovirga sp. EKP202]